MKTSTTLTALFQLIVVALIFAVLCGPVRAQGPEDPNWILGIIQARRLLGDVVSINQYATPGYYQLAKESILGLTGGSGWGYYGQGVSIVVGTSIQLPVKPVAEIPATIKEVLPAWAPGYAAYTGSALMARLAALAAGGMATTADIMGALSGFYMTPATRAAILRQYTYQGSIRN